MNHTITLTAAALAWAAASAFAQDMTFTPSAGGSVVIQTPAGTPALAVQPTGAVQLPLLPGSTPAAGTPVCHDASGALIACDASALTGPKGDQGDPGTNGTPGANGAPGTDGTNGQNSVAATAAEPVGSANCPAGGVRMQFGLDANGNGTLDAGEVNAALTRYVCNGAQGLQGLPGEKGDPGTGAGVSGLAEARHGCFAADKTVLSGTGYAVDLTGNVYTVTFAPPAGAGNYTLLLDARTSTGRALAIATGGSPGTGLTFTPGWLAADGPETIERICFMLAR